MNSDGSHDAPEKRTTTSGEDLSELSRRCTERMLKIIDVDTGRTLEKLNKTTSLGDGKARAMGVDIGFKLDTEAVEKLDKMADVVLKLEQARAAARKSDDEIERMVVERMRKAISEAGGSE